MSTNLFPSQIEQTIQSETGVRCKVRLLSQRGEHVWPKERVLPPDLLTFTYPESLEEPNVALRAVHEPLMLNPLFLSTPGDVAVALLRTLFLSDSGLALLTGHSLVRVEVNQTPLFALCKAKEDESLDAVLYINVEIQPEPLTPYRDQRVEMPFAQGSADQTNALYWCLAIVGAIVLPLAVRVLWNKK